MFYLKPYYVRSLYSMEAVYSGGYETYVTNRDGETYITFVFSTPKKKTWRDRMKAFGKYQRVCKGDPLLEPGQCCCVCLQEYQLGEYKRELPVCGHTYHKKCIDKWLRKSHSMTCPICRHDYSQHGTPPTDET